MSATTTLSATLCAPTQEEEQLFEQLFRHQELHFNSLTTYDAIYFLGDFTKSFADRAQSIAERLPQFAGVLSFTVTPAKQQRLARHLNLPSKAPLLTFEVFAETVAKQTNTKVLVLDFNDDLTGKTILNNLHCQHVQVRDYMYALHELDLAHTYLSVKEERTYIATHLESYRSLFLALGDTTSRQTLLARLKTYLTLDRTPLLQVRFPFSLFNRSGDKRLSFCLREDEVFVDAGAAYGDTVSLFYNVSRGQYKAMYAFEPDAHNFRSLRALAKHLPRTHCFHAGLGDVSGEAIFYECAENRLGSHFMNNTASTGDLSREKMKLMTLDDTVEEATLLKMDVEGYEAKVLAGAKNLIKTCKPNLSISAYHYPQDLTEIVAAVKEAHTYKHMALRHYSSNLYDTLFLLSDTQAFQ
jgi:FkbM family methyltransferase